MMRPSRILLASALFLSGVSSAAQDSRLKIATGNWKGKPVRVEIRFEPGRSDECPVGFNNCLVARGFDVKVAGQDLVVPRTVYSGMFNVLKVSVLGKGANPIIVIEGGDGSESYTIRLGFDGERILDRTLYGGTSPDEMLEKTRYFRVVVGEE